MQMLQKIGKRLARASNTRSVSGSDGSGSSSAPPLHIAAREGNLEAIQQLLQDGAAVDEVHEQRWTPVHCAAGGGHVAAIQALAAAGAGMYSVDSEERMPLHIAAHFGHADCIRALVAAGANVSCTGKDGWTPLHYAASHGHAGAVSALLEAGAAVDSQNQDEFTPMHLAAHCGHVDALLALLKGNASVDSIEADGWTPLHLAAQSGHAAAIQVLLDAGAHVEYVTHRGNTAQHLAASKGHADAIRALLAATPRPGLESKQEDGLTPLHCASRTGTAEVVRELLRAGASVLSVSDIGWTPLHYATGNGNAGAVKVLLDAGASVHSVSDRGSAPLHLAAYFGHADIVSDLLKAGAGVNCTTAKGHTPLHWAAYNGHVEVVKVLLDAGASVVCKDSRGNSPLDFAHKQKEEAAKKILEDAAGVQDENTRPVRETGSIFKNILRLCNRSTVQQTDDGSASSPAVPQVEEEVQEINSVVPVPTKPRPQPSKLNAGTAAAPQTPLGPPMVQHHYDSARITQQPPAPVLLSQPSPRNGIETARNIPMPHPPIAVGTMPNRPGKAPRNSVYSTGGQATPQLLPPTSGTGSRASSSSATRSSAGPINSAERAVIQPAPLGPRSAPEGHMVQLPRIDSDDVELVTKLGSGSFSEVWQGRWMKTDVAMKVLVLKEMDDSTAHFAQTMRDLQKEANLMAQLRHPNIVQFLGICFGSKPGLLMSLYTDSLASLLARALKSPNGNEAAMLTWQRRIMMLQNAASGMYYLHNYKPQVLHRDFKSPNLLVDQDGSLKVADFGLSRLVETATAKTSNTMDHINPRWLSPELARQGGQATPSSDVFAFGLVMWEMLTWRLPWHHVDRYTEISICLSERKRPPIPPRHELPGAGSGSWTGLDDYLTLMQDCWAQDPCARPSFKVVVDRLDELLKAA